MTTRIPQSILKHYILPVILLLGTALAVFYLAVDIAPDFGISSRAFVSFYDGLDTYKADFPAVWRPRLLANAFASGVVRMSKSILSRTSIPLAGEPTQLAIGLWTMGWFLLIGALFIFWSKKASIFYIFGLYAGVNFGYLPIGGSLGTTIFKNYIYPWDMPALFVFTLFTILFIQKKYGWLVALIPLGVAFKETALILCLGFLLKDFSWSRWNPFKVSFWRQFTRQSWFLMVSTLLLGLLVKGLIGLLVQVPPFLSMEYVYEGTSPGPLLMTNISLLAGIFPLLANAGLLLALFVIPARDGVLRAFKIIAVLFVLGNLLFGVINEYRIWFELIPFSLYALGRDLTGQTP